MIPTASASATLGSALSHAGRFVPRPSRVRPAPQDVLLSAIKTQVDEALGEYNSILPPVPGSDTYAHEMSETPEIEATEGEEEIDIGLPTSKNNEPVDTGEEELAAYFSDISSDPFGTNTPMQINAIPPVEKALEGVKKIVKPGFLELSRHGAPALDYDTKQAELHNMLRRLVRRLQG